MRNPKPKTGKRSENKARTKRKILEAALELFSTKGFYQTTTKQISLKAKIAEGTLFNYFKTKEELALYFFELELEELIDWFERQKHLQSATLPEKLFAIVHHLLERITPYEEFIGAVYLRALQPVSKLNPLSLEHQALSVRYLRFIRGVLEASEAAQEIPPLGDLGAYGFALFQMAIITYWLHDQSANKEATLALLDRSLKMAGAVLRKGGWEW